MLGLALQSTAGQLEAILAALQSINDRLSRVEAALASKQPTADPITVRDAVARLGLSERTIRSQIAAGEIAVVRLGTSIRIPAAEMARLTGASLSDSQRANGAQGTNGNGGLKERRRRANRRS